MLWAKSVADRTPISTEGFNKCLDPLFAESVFAIADCFCDQCGCAPQDCLRVATYTVLAAVNVSQRAAIEAGGPEVGDSYFVVDGISDGVWTVGYVYTWNGTGWDGTQVVPPQYVNVAGTIWRVGAGGVPGPADPPVTVTFVGPPDIYTVVSDYPSIAANSSRTVYILAFGPGGWEIVLETIESNLTSPIPLPLQGFTMTDVSALYIDGDCEYPSGPGTIEPSGCFFPRDHDCSDHDTSDHS